MNQTTDSITVICAEGFDGGVPKQEFLVELWDEATRGLVTNQTASRPQFKLSGLESGVDYRADVFAYNSKGRSEPARLHGYTLKGAERRLGESRPETGPPLTLRACTRRTSLLAVEQTNGVRGRLQPRRRPGWGSRRWWGCWWAWWPRWCWPRC